MKGLIRMLAITLIGIARSHAEDVPAARLAEFKADIEPVIMRVCAECHGAEKQKGDFRLDTLDPNLLTGEDVNWWLEVFEVISNGEMPPEDAGAQLTDAEKAQIVDWLSGEIQTASQVRRSGQGHTSFRRMTRYEYKYALQDLLGVPHDFSRDLPPETASHDGFKNSSEMLQMTANQFEQYRQLARKALERATVRGKRPEPVYYGISMRDAAKAINHKYTNNIEGTRKRIEDEGLTVEEAFQRQGEKFPRDHNGLHYRDLITGQGIGPRWSYNKAKYAWTPTRTRPAVPPVSADVVVIPKNAKYIIDLGDDLPDTGNMRVRIRAARYAEEKTKNPNALPTLRLFFGNQASNDSRVAVRAGEDDITVTASPDHPEFYHWDVRLSEIARNAYRHITRLGDLPNPAEFLFFRNISNTKAAVQVDYVEITAPTFDRWPPESHKEIFFDRGDEADDDAYARQVLARFMRLAWRRPATLAEIDQKMALVATLRPQCEDLQETLTEVLATVLSSPKFLYLIQADRPADSGRKNRVRSDFELASRLSFFLWSSTPDHELLDLATRGKLQDPSVLQEQTRRMLDDPRTRRLAHHFTRQWLGLDLLDFWKVDSKTHGAFDPILLEAMREEPVAFFRHVLQHNRSVMEFLHSDYAMVNDRLARHYGLPEVDGATLHRVSLDPADRRGGLLTQAGLLAMNSDGKDSHPLKRGIWLLEKILNDPPPPPPPAVPEIDLADPEILKLTLKQRMERHRDDPACYSCHAKIDPWGIAFENFDAVGKWRDTIGEDAVDATGHLFNKHELHGMQGLKDYLLGNRQDQFARALAHKMATYALGRPLTFGDRSEIDRIASELRDRGDGLRDLIVLVVTSDLFRVN
ncbi:MAG: DUF1592 domain-containing protein [Verrucomicrobiota bacterium]